MEECWPDATKSVRLRAVLADASEIRVGSFTGSRLLCFQRQRRREGEQDYGIAQRQSTSRITRIAFNGVGGNVAFVALPYLCVPYGQHYKAWGYITLSGDQGLTSTARSLWTQADEVC